jgi:hypothetical protein
VSLATTLELLFSLLGGGFQAAVQRIGRPSSP